MIFYTTSTKTFACELQKMSKNVKRLVMINQDKPI